VPPFLSVVARFAPVAEIITPPLGIINLNYSNFQD